MRKMAIFVEGQTEQIFVERLLETMSDQENLAIEKCRAFGGKKNGRRFTTLKSAKGHEGEIFILLVDCSNDGRVLSDIREQYARLVRKGYTKIIGLRDVYPHKVEELHRLKSMTGKVLPKKPVRTRLVFAMLEIETWFLAEYTHFKRVHHKLTRAVIEEELGIDPASSNIEEDLRPEKDEHDSSPAGDLNRIYHLVGKGYRKRRHQVNQIVGNLDYRFILEELPKNVQGLRIFLNHVKSFVYEGR